MSRVVSYDEEGLSSVTCVLYTMESCNGGYYIAVAAAMVTLFSFSCGYCVLSTHIVLLCIVVGWQRRPSHRNIYGQ